MGSRYRKTCRCGDRRCPCEQRRKGHVEASRVGMRSCPKWRPLALVDLLLDGVDDLRPPADAELVGDDLAVLDDQPARRAALARDLLEDRREIAPKKVCHPAKARSS